ncbi:MAG: mechanosensitive ion channel domain-containing protein [Chloroflexota bacterium]
MTSHSSKLRALELLLKSLLPICLFVGLSYLALAHLEPATGAILLGVLALSLSSSASGILQGLLAGIYLDLERPIRPGDRINLAGITGQVEVIEARVTRLRLDDGSLALIPNATILTTPLVILGNIPQPHGEQKA